MRRLVRWRRRRGRDHTWWRRRNLHEREGSRSGRVRRPALEEDRIVVVEGLCVEVEARDAGRRGRDDDRQRVDRCARLRDERPFARPPVGDDDVAREVRRIVEHDTNRARFALSERRRRVEPGRVAKALTTPRASAIRSDIFGGRFLSSFSSGKRVSSITYAARDSSARSSTASVRASMRYPRTSSSCVRPRWSSACRANRLAPSKSTFA